MLPAEDDDSLRSTAVAPLSAFAAKSSRCNKKTVIRYKNRISKYSGTICCADLIAKTVATMGQNKVRKHIIHSLEHTNIQCILLMFLKIIYK